jgi:hypothetical protein
MNTPDVRGGQYCAGVYSTRAIRYLHAQYSMRVNHSEYEANKRFSLRSILKSIVITEKIEQLQVKFKIYARLRQIVREQMWYRINETKHSPYSSPHIRQICHNA